MNIARRLKVVPVMMETDWASGKTADSINVTGAHRVTFIINLGTMVGTSVMTINSGVANGAKTTALTFKYAYGSAAIGATTSDVLGDDATSAALSVDAATYSTKMIIAEVNMSQIATATHKFLTLDFATGATSGPVSIVALVEPRYSNGLTSV